MKPTIGRIVTYTDTSENFKKLNNGSEVAPATIVRVWNNQGTVNLKVHTDGPQDEWRPSTMFKEEWERSFPHSPAVRYWSWPVIEKQPLSADQKSVE